MATSDPVLAPKKVTTPPVPAAKAAPVVASAAAPVAKAPISMQKTDASSVPKGKLNDLLPGDEPENPGNEPQFHHAGGFWNLPWVQNVLPLATSLAIHVSILTVGLLFFLGAKTVFKDVNKEQTIIPDSKPVEKNQMPGGIEHPGPLADPTRDVAQDQNKDTDNQGFNVTPSKSMDSAGGSTSNEDASQFEGVTSAQGKGHSGAGGSGDAFGSGTGGGSAPFGVPGGGGGMLPKSNFMGTGGSANKIVFLCDASGSMLSVFGALKQSLKTSVTSLQAGDGQEFNVIFFSDDNCFPLFKDGMQMATDENKKLAMDFIDNAVSTGGTQPLPAIKFALGINKDGKLVQAARPELLYVLTDGFDQISNFDDVTNVFKAGNPDGKVHVNCIFLESDPDPKLEECLKKIATDPKVGFKKIEKADM